MAARVPTPIPPRRVLATGFGAFLVLYVLTAAWVVVGTDTESAATDAEPTPTIRPKGPSTGPENTTTTTSPEPTEPIVAVEVTDDTLIITGSVSSIDDAAWVLSVALELRTFTLVINQLEIDPAVGPVQQSVIRRLLARDVTEVDGG